jgi:hypothetical protein
MAHALHDALESAHDLAKRVDHLARRIDGPDISAKEITAGDPVPLLVITEFCMAHGLQVPRSLKRAVEVLPNSYEWAYDCSEYGVVDEEAFPDGVFGGFSWFNTVARGLDYEAELVFAHQHLRRPGVSAVLPLITIGNGDAIALQVDDETVWYLDHEAVVDGSRLLADSISDFFWWWSDTGFPCAGNLVPLLYDDADACADFRTALDAALERQVPLPSHAGPVDLSLHFSPSPSADERVAPVTEQPPGQVRRRTSESLDNALPLAFGQSGLSGGGVQAGLSARDRRWWWPFGPR